MKLTSIAGLILCAGFALNAGAQTTTLPGPVVFPDNGHMYMLTTVRSNWTAAESFALGLGGHLVSINSQAEQNFIVSTFLADTVTTSTLPLWIGLTDQPNHDSQSYTTWTTGESVTFRNFNPDEPNNLHTNEDYVVINWHYSFGTSTQKGTWNDVPLNGTTEDFGGVNARSVGPYYGIVEIVPEPGTTWLMVLGAFAVLHMIRRGRSGVNGTRPWPGRR